MTFDERVVIDRVDFEAFDQLGQDEPASGRRWSHCSGSTALYRADVSWNISPELRAYLRPHMDTQVLDVRDNRGCSGKGRTALEGLGRLKRALAVHL